MRNISNIVVVACTLMYFSSCSQNNTKTEKSNQTKAEAKPTAELKTKKMKIEIWSDVMCPFCYIGKRKFENALSQFKDRDHVEIVWKSFQLNPNLKTDPNKNTLQHLSESKGWSMEYTRNTVNHVSNMAKEVGLEYNFDKAIVANSFDAHRLIQMAKKYGKGDAAEERLFKAYFTEGKNTADHTILLQLAKEIGLDETEVSDMLKGKEFTKEVLNDLQEADQLRISGVPFFVFDRKYAVSGAQQSDVFLDTLKKAWEHYSSNNPLIITNDKGQSCTPEGECK